MSSSDANNSKDGRPKEGEGDGEGYKMEVQWEKGDETKVDGFLDRARQGIHCSLFCGGVQCKHEDWKYFCTKRKHNVPAAFEGLNSSWVGDNVVASQRPSKCLFQQYLLVQQFRRAHLTGVFNLQEKGEHSSCGPNGILASSGYSYNGEEDLMKYNISYYEFPWPDMTAPNNDIVLRSVQVMHHHVLHKGKVLVHCHAGLGRTGLMIACFLIYGYQMKAEDAITVVRTQRPGAVQTSKQVAFIGQFENHLKALLMGFRVEVSDGPVVLVPFMKRQRMFLHGEIGRTFRYVPRHIHIALCRLIELSKADQKNAILALKAFSQGVRLPEEAVNQLRMEVNSGVFSGERASPQVLAYFTLDWFRRFSSPVLEHKQGQKISEYQRMFPAERVSLDKAAAKLFPDKIVRSTLEMVLSATSILGKIANDTNLKRFALNCVADAFFHFHLHATVAAFGGQMKHLIYDFISDYAGYVGLSYFPLKLGAAGTSQLTKPVAMLTPQELSAIATFKYFNVSMEEEDDDAAKATTSTAVNGHGGEAAAADAEGEGGEGGLPALAGAEDEPEGESLNQSLNGTRNLRDMSPRSAAQRRVDTPGIAVET